MTFPDLHRVIEQAAAYQVFHCHIVTEVVLQLHFH